MALKKTEGKSSLVHNKSKRYIVLQVSANLSSVRRIQRPLTEVIWQITLNYAV